MTIICGTNKESDGRDRGKSGTGEEGEGSRPQSHPQEACQPDPGRGIVAGLVGPEDPHLQLRRPGAQIPSKQKLVILALLGLTFLFTCGTTSLRLAGFILKRPRRSYLGTGCQKLSFLGLPWPVLISLP